MLLNNLSILVHPLYRTDCSNADINRGSCIGGKQYSMRNSAPSAPFSVPSAKYAGKLKNAPKVKTIKNRYIRI